MWFPLFADPRLASSVGPAPDALQWLDSAGALTIGNAADAAKVGPGDLVDFVGEAQGNPLIRVLDFVATSMAVLNGDGAGPGAGRNPGAGPDRGPGAGRQAGAGSAADRRPPRARSRLAESGGQGGPDQGGTTPEAHRLVATLAAVARDDLRNSPAVDVVMIVGDDLPVVLTLDREVTGPGIEALLDSGRYRVVGKVSEVIGPGEGISLLRRTLLAATGLEGGRDMLVELADSGAELAMTDPVVDGPALAVLPLAILI